MENEKLDLDLRYRTTSPERRANMFRRKPPRLTKSLRQLRAVGGPVPRVLPHSQPAIVKGWIATPSTTPAHCRYLARHKDAPSGREAVLFGPTTRPLDVARFLALSQHDPHQFRFVVALHAGRPDVLPEVVHRLMESVQHDVYRPLDWVAAVHENSAHPHAHVLLRGRDRRGEPLYIVTRYLQHALRAYASIFATRTLGLAPTIGQAAAQQAEVRRGHEMETWIGGHTRGAAQTKVEMER